LLGLVGFGVVDLVAWLHLFGWFGFLVVLADLVD
jgi:hypothetical protein